MVSHPDSLDDLTGRRAAKRRVRRIIALALAASAAAHAAALVWMPRFSFEEYELTKVSALEVVLASPEPLPVAPPEVTPPPREKRAPERTAAKRAPETRPEQPARTAAPLIALQEPRPPDAPTSLPETQPAPRIAPPPPAEKAQPKGDLAHATLTPPSFGASYLRNPPPRYPLAARRAGEQGTVTLKVLVTREGMPARVEVEKTSGSSHLDSAALETVRIWRFRPARQGAEPIESWVLVPIVFRLEGSS